MSSFSLGGIETNIKSALRIFVFISISIFSLLNSYEFKFKPSYVNL